MNILIKCMFVFISLTVSGKYNSIAKKKDKIKWDDLSALLLLETVCSGEVLGNAKISEP